MESLRCGNPRLRCYISTTVSALNIVEAKAAGHHSGLDPCQSDYFQEEMQMRDLTWVGVGVTGIGVPVVMAVAYPLLPMQT